MKKIAVTISVICLSFGVAFADWCFEYQKNRDTADKAIGTCTDDIPFGEA
jgi:hypothetical protein